MTALVRLLGRGSIALADQVWEPPADRRSALLYYVAYARGWVPREDLLVLFYPDSDERRARANLRQLLASARARPFADGLEVEPSRVRWPVATDVARFDEALAHARFADLDGAWDRPLLDGFRLSGAPEFESWLDLERSDRQERVRSSLCAAARRSLEEGRTSEVAALLDRYLVVDPVHEEAFRLWAEASASIGRRGAVLERYRSFASRLRGAFGVEPAAETRAFVERLRVATDPPEHGRSRPPPPRLPKRAHLGRFHGREAELARLDEDLVPGAVVAVVGVGGMGKSRLVFEGVERAVARFADGVVYAELRDVRDADQAGAVLARAVGCDAPPGDSVRARTAEPLAGRNALVVLDNVEQVDGIELALAAWRASAPEATWLVTSRRKLATHDASTLELGGLPYPGEHEDDAPDGDFASIALLAERARQVGAQVDLERDRFALASVARSAAGMPLALELAAGWLRVVPSAVVAAELASGLDLLRAADEPADPRHGSVRAVFDASWATLMPSEQAALVALAPFHGGFTEAAARAVAQVGRPMLLALRNKSFVSLGGHGRFVQHPLLEAYVRDRASADPAFDAARARHARWVFETLEAEEWRGQHGAAAAALEAVVDELPNVEASWTYAIEAGFDARLHVGGATLVNAFRRMGRAAVYDDLVRRARSAAAPGTASWGWLHLSGWSTATDRFGRDPEAYAEAEDALTTLHRVEDDPHWLAWAHFVFAHTAVGAGRRGRARMAIAEAADRYAALEDWDLVGEMRVTEYLLVEDPDERQQLFERVDGLARRAANTDLMVRSKRLHARFVATTFGDWGTALRLLEEVIVIERGRAAPPERLVDPLLGAAGLTTAIGDLDLAERFASEAQALANGMGARGRSPRSDALCARAQIAWLRRDIAQATSLLETASEGGTSWPIEALRCRLALDAGDLGAARVHVERATFGATDALDPRASAVTAVRLDVLRAEVALAAGERRHARSLAAEAIERARAAALLPELLGALAAATPLVPEVMRADLVAWCSSHPAAEFEVRLRLSDARRDAVEGGFGHDWPATRSFAERVLRAVRRGTEGASSG